MNYHKDDGSFGSGLFMARCFADTARVVILAAFICGYALRDSGFKLQIDLSPISAPLQRL
jgi:hypothetical protein